MPGAARLQGAAGLRQAFGEAGQAVAGAVARAAGAVVLDGEFEDRAVEGLAADEVDRAAPGAAVPYDVGDRLAQRPGEGVVRRPWSYY